MAAFGLDAVPLLAGGRLLVASPSLRDPNFSRTVVLLLEVDTGGALGLVLNRPGGLPVAELLPGWLGAASDPAVLHVGGPVSPSSAICLGQPLEPAPPVGFAPLREPGGGQLAWGTVDLDADPDAVVPYLARLRIFAGYAGWSPDQLAAEVAEGAWYVLQPDPEDPFTADPGRLWTRVLARQGGALARVATMPEDPALN